MIRRDELSPGGVHYFYDSELFPPTTDSFALAWFAAAKRGEAVCDLGCGIGLLSVLLLAREPSLRVCAVEMDGAAAALARKNAEENGWTVDVRRGDLRDASILPAAGSMDRVVANPPYFPAGNGAGIAREECACPLDALCASAQRILRIGGAFDVVYRVERLVDLLCAMRAHGIEPKRLRGIETKRGAAPTLFLVEGRRNGKPQLTIEPSLTADDPVWDEIYFRK